MNLKHSLFIFFVCAQVLTATIFLKGRDDIKELLEFEPLSEIEKLVNGTSKKTKEEVIIFALRIAKDQYIGPIESSYWGIIDYKDTYLEEVIFLTSLAFDTDNLSAFFKNFMGKLVARQYEIRNDLDLGEYYCFECHDCPGKISSIYGIEINKQARDYWRKIQKKDHIDFIDHLYGKYDMAILRSLLS